MRFIGLSLLLLLSGCSATAPDSRTRAAPAASPASETAALAPWPFGGMVSVANPLAAEAAAEVLRRGGHAVDAAIAAHAVLGLVEPQSSGLGGGAFMLVYERASGSLRAYDGREVAPAGARPDMFMVEGAEMGFLEAWQSGLAVGVPGTIALYDRAHQRYGRLAMEDDVGQAIDIARRGFEVSPRLAGFLEQVPRFTRLEENPDTAAYFYPDGRALTAGTLLKNPDYAHTLERFVAEGPAAFYEGEIAQAMVAAAGAQPNPGTLSLEDLARYQVAEREALCTTLVLERVCTMPPPSSGLTQIMILGLYDRLAGERRQPAGVLSLSDFVDAQRLAYADRDHYVADADAVDVPAQALVDARYLDARARERFAPDAIPAPGDPGAVIDGTPIIDRWGRDDTAEIPGTTHLSIVDTWGNAVSMTATVEGVFGSSRWAAGFLLNNQMTDFARTPTQGGRPVANAVAPGQAAAFFDVPGDRVGRRGESDDGERIAGWEFDHRLRGQDADRRAARQPVGAGGGRCAEHRRPRCRGARGERSGGWFGGGCAAHGLGYPVQAREGENSGLHAILVGPQGLEGAADPRREGRVIAVPARR